MSELDELVKIRKLLKFIAEDVKDRMNREASP